MRSLWTEQRKLEIWLEIETLACEAMAELGTIPKEDAVTIREKGKFEIETVREIEKRTNHDVIAFLENVASFVGPAARWVHQGLTSSDLLDTTLAVQMNQACEILLQDLIELREAIAKRAIEHKFTPMIGRSHGIHAEPITFGLKMALMYDEFGRSIDRLEEMRERIRVGKISGAVGTHAHLDPEGGKIRLRQARAQGFSAVHADHPARPPRRVHDRARDHRQLDRPLGHRVPPPPAHWRCSRLRNISPRARRAAPRCRTSAIPSPASV